MKVFKQEDIKYIVAQHYLELVKVNSQTNDINKKIENLESFLASLFSIGDFGIFSDSPMDLIAYLNKLKEDLWKKYGLPKDPIILQSNPKYQIGYQAFLQEYARILNIFVGFIIGKIYTKKEKLRLKDVDIFEILKEG